MLNVLNRDYKQSIESIRREFPNSRYVVRVDELLDESGYLLAISSDKSSFVELGDYIESVSQVNYLRVGGEYAEEVGFGVLSSVN